MSADGSVVLFFGDAEYKFRFAIGEFRELQEKINGRRVALGAPIVGPMTLLKALEAKDVWPDDIRDVIRIGMVGGGLKPADVHKLLVTHFDRSPPLEHILVATAALFVGLLGSPADPIEAKKKTEPMESTTEIPTPRSNSPDSTATAQP